MAEINSNLKSKQPGIARMVHKSTRVDLTPMVDLGFLLITFFVFTTQLQQPTVLKVNMPYDKVKPDDEVCASCALTVLLKDSNLIQYCEGIPAASTIVHTTGFNNTGIRNVILTKKATLKSILPGKELVVIIKSAKESTFSNFVDMLDEVMINDVKHYYLSEMNSLDTVLFAIR